MNTPYQKLLETVKDTVQRSNGQDPAITILINWLNSDECVTGDKVETIVDGPRDAREIRGEPKPTCSFPLFPNHDPNYPVRCGKPAVIVDALFPVYWQGNRCEEHLNAEPEMSFHI